MFIVVLVLTMLTAIGIFAMRASSLSSATSGYERQATQNQTIAECAIAVAVAELASTRRDAYLQKMLASADQCLAVQGVTVNGGKPPCYRMFASDFRPNPCAVAGTTTGAGPLESDFMVEMTDPGPASGSMAGAPLSGAGPFRFLQVTMTGTGQVRLPTNGVANPASAAVAGNASNRAFIVVGPL